jgi:hypothetical protein
VDDLAWLIDARSKCIVTMPSSWQASPFLLPVAVDREKSVKTPSADHFGRRRENGK